MVRVRETLRGCDVLLVLVLLGREVLAPVLRDREVLVWRLGVLRWRVEAALLRLVEVRERLLDARALLPDERLVDLADVWRERARLRRRASADASFSSCCLR